MTAPEATNPLPPECRFDVVWRGYSRRQVNDYVGFELRVLTADRDAAMTMVNNLTALLAASWMANQQLQQRLDRLCRQPLSPNAIGERTRRQIEMARAEAARIVTRAHAAGEHIRITTAETAQRHEEHAQRRRQQIEEDFQIAMVARRAEAMHRIRDYEQSCRAEADRLVEGARQAADRLIASALTQVQALQIVRRHLALRLRIVCGLFLRACELVDPIDTDVDTSMTGHSVTRRSDAADRDEPDAPVAAIDLVTADTKDAGISGPGDPRRE